MSRRPELEVPAEIYYGGDNARKYHMASRVQEIQRRMTERALELLALPAGEQCLLLDLGAGSGLAGEVLQAAGHSWVGTDISMSMLQIAKQREKDAVDRFDEEDDDDEDADNVADANGNDDDDDDNDEEGAEEDEEMEDVNPAKLGRKIKKAYTYDIDAIEGPQPVEVMQHDMGTPIPFRPGTFDGCISISALQWLCNIDRKGQVPQRRLKDLFQSLFNSLRRGARAVFQFYPANPQQTAMITTQATRCGFGGGVIVDYPHSSKARKYYLVLYAGLAPAGYRPPRPLGEEDPAAAASDSDAEIGSDGEEYLNAAEGDEDGDQTQVRMFPRDRRRHQRLTGRAATEAAGGQHRAESGSKAHRPKAGSKSWIMMKKQQQRKFDKEGVRPDSKYTGRKRPDRF